MEKLLLRPEECAAALGIARTKVWALLANGEIESVKVGRRRLVPADAIDAFVARLREQHETAGDDRHV